MEDYYVDFSEVTDKETFYQRLRESLPLPEWCGRNLDALFDALTDLDGSCIHFLNWGPLEAKMPAYFERFRRMIADAQMETPDLFCFFDHSGDKESTDGREKRDCFSEEGIGDAERFEADDGGE